MSTADANPVGAVPGAKTTEPPGLKTLVTAVTDQGSTYTLTYVPSTITAATVLVEGTSTASVNAGAVIGALAGGAALAALPFAIPKAVPEPVLEGDGSDGGSENTQRRPGCETKTAKACTEDCTADWFVSSKKVQTTATCTTATCTQNWLHSHRRHQDQFPPRGHSHGYDSNNFISSGTDDRSATRLWRHTGLLREGVFTLAHRQLWG